MHLILLKMPKYAFSVLLLFRLYNQVTNTKSSPWRLLANMYLYLKICNISAYIT